MAVCKNIVVSANESCQANASIDSDSYDTDSGDSIAVSLDPAGPYNLGSTEVTLTVTDSSGESDSCTATVIVVNDTAPSITCPSNQTTECTGHDGAIISFTDPTVEDNCPGVGATCTAASGSTFPLGDTPITCTATDNAGLQSSCSFNVKVEDTTPPEISVSITPDTLWPPNHKMVPVNALISVNDAYDDNPLVTIESIIMSEGDSVNTYDPNYDSSVGDGNTENDVQEADFGTDDRSFLLRAERSGTGNGRTYTITCSSLQT